jgi:hypothetical protein
MRSIRARWTLPTLRSDGITPFPVNEIAGVEIGMSVDPATFGFTIINTIAPDTVELVVPDLEAGMHFFQGVVIDTKGQRSAAVRAQIEIMPPVPGELTELVIELV